MTVEPLRVRDFMTRDLVTVHVDAEIMDAVRLLVEEDISGIPVVDGDDKLVGILTERDCISIALSAGYFDEMGGSVKGYMISPVHTVDADSSLLDVGELFANSKFRRCPVVEADRLVGLIARRDVLRALTHGQWFDQPRE